MRAAVEAEAPLAQRLELADTPELVVDETLLLLPPRPPPDAPPPRQRADELRLSVEQVSRLAERFRAETRAPTLPLRAAIDVLLRAAAAGELPSVWRHFERTVLHEACRLFCSGHAQQLSWHALLCALAQTPVPTAEQLAETSAALQAASDGGWLTLAGWEATPLWFARSPAPADEGEEGGGEAAATAAEFDVEAVRAPPAAARAAPSRSLPAARSLLTSARPFPCRARRLPTPRAGMQALKEALFHALATHSAGSPAKLHAQRFVLYACDSLPKAFAAMAPAHSGAVSADELHALLHRDMLPLSATATPVAVGAHADPFSMEVIHRCAHSPAAAPSSRPRRALGRPVAPTARCALRGIRLQGSLLTGPPHRNAPCRAADSSASSTATHRTTGCPISWWRTTRSARACSTRASCTV